MVRCMPWYCWTMLRRWLIGGVRFFQSFWEGVEVDLLYFLAWENDSISWRLPRRKIIFWEAYLCCLVFFLWVNFKGMLDKGFFPKMALRFSGCWVKEGSTTNSLQPLSKSASKHPLNLGLCGFVAFGSFG